LPSQSEKGFSRSDFSFHLPRELIARFPADKRDQSRLMVIDRQSGSIRHEIFHNIPRFLEEDDFLVMNATRVDPARLLGDISGKPVEALIVRWMDDFTAEVLAMPASRFQIGRIVRIGVEVEAVVDKLGERGKRTLRFSAPFERVEASGFAPLPPYIKRKRDEAERYRDYDRDRYQTVFGRHGGSIAAPTAGLHFTPELLSEIGTRHPIFELNLTVGTATFQKLEADDIRDHRMGLEQVVVPFELRARIADLKSKGSKLLAVGTTSIRSLESLASLQPVEEIFCTDLFIYPGFHFRLTDRILTNFHLPESTLFILVCAFAGRELMQEAYAMAIAEKYRFFSYGDAMLIL